MAADAALTQMCSSAGAQAEEALALLSKILSNIAEQPAEDKFRRLNPGSTKLQGGLLCHQGAVEFLTAVGFTRTSDGVLELPRGAEPRLVPARSLVARHAERLRSRSGVQKADPLAAAYRAAVEGGARGAGLAEVEALARTHEGQEALVLLEKVFQNARLHRENEKYQCVNLAKAAGQKVMVAAPLLQLAGFQAGKLPGGEECLRLVRFDPDVLERLWAMVFWAYKPAPQLQLPPSAAGNPVLSHVLGAVLGAAIGDALAAPLGGRQPFEVTAEEVDKAMEMCGSGHWGVAPGQTTGQTELAVCLAEALAEAPDPARDFPLEDIAVRYGRWGQSLPFRGDSACKRAFQRPLAAENMAERARELNQKAAGSGALTRCSPLVALGAGARSPAVAARAARQDAALSHPSYTVSDASAIYVVTATLLAQSQGDRQQAMAGVEAWLQSELQSGPPHPALGDGRDAGWTHLSPGGGPPPPGKGQPDKWEAPNDRAVALEVVAGWVKKAMRPEAEVAFSDFSAGAILDGEVGSVEIPIMHAFRHLHQGSSFEDAMRAVLAGGGDTCAIAGVVGGLLGAAVGLQGLPARWVKAVLGCDVGLGQPRPPDYQPSCLLGHVCRIWERAAARAAAA